MDTFGLEYLGLYIRYLYIIIYKKENITLKELWKKTKYGENIGHIKTSNHNIGALLCLILLIFILIGKILSN